MDKGELIIDRPLVITPEQLLAIFLRVPVERVGIEVLKRMRAEKEAEK